MTKDHPRFLNPYNFSPLVAKVRRQSHAAWFTPESDNSLYSGWLSYRLDPLSPLCVPDSRYRSGAATPQEEFLPFFSYDSDEQVVARKEIMPVSGKTDADRAISLDWLEKKDPSRPVIPGSEIRGMLRAAHAAFSNGCLSQLREDQLLGKRSSQPLNQTAILEATLQESGVRWTLRQAETCKLNTHPKNMTKRGWHTDFSDGSRICYKRSDLAEDACAKNISRFFVKKYIKAKEQTGPLQPCLAMKAADSETTYTGILHISNDVDKKSSETVFHLVGSQPVLLNKAATTAAEGFYKTLLHYQESAHEKKIYSMMFEKMDQLLHRPYEIDRADFPMYFPLYHDDPCTVFSPAMLSFRPSKKVILDFVMQTEHQPCTSPEDLCATCALFGRVFQNKSQAGSLRFSDAVLEKSEAVAEDYITLSLPELSTPRISSTEFYLQNPKALESGKKKNPSLDASPCEEPAYWDFDQLWENENKQKTYPNGRLKGRKFYWHHGGNTLVRSPANQADPSRSTTVRALRAIPRPVEDTPCSQEEGQANARGMTGRIWFDKVPLSAVRQMVWLINPSGNNAKSLHAHHIGTGKPVGLGSVRLQPLSLYFCEEEDPSMSTSGDMHFKTVDLSIPSVLNEWRKEGMKAFQQDRTGNAEATAAQFLRNQDVRALLLLHDFDVTKTLGEIASKNRFTLDPQIIRYPQGQNGADRGIHYFFALNRNLGKISPFPFQQILHHPYEGETSDKTTPEDTLLQMLLTDLP